MAIAARITETLHEAVPSRHVAWSWAMGLTGAGFVALAVAAHLRPILPWDLEITRAVQHVRTAWFQSLLWPFNRLGFPPLVDIVYGSITILVLLRGMRWHRSSWATRLPARCSFFRWYRSTRTIPRCTCRTTFA